MNEYDDRPILMMHEHRPERELVFLPKGATLMNASLSLHLSYKVERAGKFFFLRDMNGKIAATIDLQKITGLSDEETAQLVARLDEKIATKEAMRIFEEIEPEYSKTNAKLADL